MGISRTQQDKQNNGKDIKTTGNLHFCFFKPIQYTLCERGDKWKTCKAYKLGNVQFCRILQGFY